MYVYGIHGLWHVACFICKRFSSHMMHCHRVCRVMWFWTPLSHPCGALWVPNCSYGVLVVMVINWSYLSMAQEYGQSIIKHFLDHISSFSDALPTMFPWKPYIACSWRLQRDLLMFCPQYYVGLSWINNSHARHSLVALPTIVNHWTIPCQSQLSRTLCLDFQGHLLSRLINEWSFADDRSGHCPDWCFCTGLSGDDWSNGQDSCSALERPVSNLLAKWPSWSDLLGPVSRVDSSGATYLVLLLVCM